jgi:polyhydroxyalkanoate synthase
MSLVSKSYIFDLRPGASFVEVLLDQGLDVFMLDWGVPDERDAGNTLETYCDDYLPRAVRATLQASGARDVTVLGYCLGGVLTLLYVRHISTTPCETLRSSPRPSISITSDRWHQWPRAVVSKSTTFSISPATCPPT